MKNLTVIDLFSGCGGLALGMEQAGFQTLAAIDNDPMAIWTIQRNLPSIPVVARKNLRTFKPEHLDVMLRSALKKDVRVDVVIGGPPCQGFSTARQVDGANHGERLKQDSRRQLYKYFLAYVAYFQPSVFVMENVPGIRSAAGGKYFAKVQVDARALGYRVHAEEISGWHFGVPQKRIRQLIIGTRRELPIFAGRLYMRPTHGADTKRKETSLWEAIGDLPSLAAGEGTHVAEYDMTRRAAHVSNYGDWYLREVLEVPKARTLTAHVARPHSGRDLRDFARLREGEHAAQAIARGEKMEFPYDRLNFKDRFTRQHRNRLCSTIVAHLSKDGLMFIHPTQSRSLSPREAARVQSFPDWFEFPEARTHSFRLIGNAVPPLVGKAVGRAIQAYLAPTDRHSALQHIPREPAQALECLRPIMNIGPKDLGALSRQEFLRAWFAIGFLHNQLHPDSAVANGKRKSRVAEIAVSDKSVVRIFSPVFKLSGWPVSLVPVATEARRRLQSGAISLDDYYCSDAYRAGALWNLGDRNGGH